MYKVWREFAKSNNWSFHLGLLGYPSIFGEYRGHQFKLDFGSYDVEFLRQNRKRTRLTIPVHNSVEAQFTLRGGFSEIFKKIIRFQRLPTGDRLFDQHFSLTGKPEKVVLELFADDKIRRGLRDARIRMGGISVMLREQVLICEPQLILFGTDFKNASKVIMNVLDVVSDLADAVNKLEEMKYGD